MAEKLVREQSISIRQACQIFVISETCYRYKAKLSDDNACIADWLLQLTHNQKNWGFGLCFFIFTQCERLFLKPQTCLSHL